ncbi:MAG: polysaccharide biosynthesis C-terminal domain-containing protein [Flavobacteriaceae bacterium]
MSKIKSFFKDTIVYGLAAVLPKAVNVFLVSLHTLTLSTSQFSVNTIFYVWIAYLNILLTYGMETAFFRFYNTEKSKDKVISTSFISLLSTTVLALAILLYFSSPIADFMGFSKPIFFQMMITIAILDTLVVIPFAYLRVKGKSLQYAGFKILSIVIYAIFNILFLWYLPQHPESSIRTIISFEPSFKEGYIFVANLIASGFIFIALLPIMFKAKWNFDFQLWKKMLVYAWPVLVAGLAYTTNENLDKLVLEDLVGADSMGAYAGAYKIGVMMSLYILAFRLGAEPFFFNQAKEKNAKTNYALITKWFTIVGSLFLLTIVVLIYPIASIFLKSSAYYAALDIVPIILAANLFLGVYNNLSIWYKLTNKTKYGMYISVFGALLTAILLFQTIPAVGYIGAAWATFIAYGAMMLISYFLGRKHYKVPYDLLGIGLYLTIAIAFSFLSFYQFRENYWVGISLILCLCIIIYLREAKELKSLLQRF